MRTGRSFVSIKFMTIIMAAGMVACFSTESHAQSDRQHIRDGNRDYRAGKFGEAELAYRRAADIPKATADVWFNLGNAIYRQDKFEDAASTYEKNAAQTDNAIKKSNSFYNMGNSLLSSQRIEESIEAYKRSLRLNPGNMEAKYNLAYAQDMLRKQEQQQQQENQQGKDQDQNQDQEEENQNRSGDRQEGKNDQQRGGDDRKEDTANEQQQQTQEGQPGISEEDARRLLEALAANEQNIQEKVQKEKAVASIVRTLKNW